MANALPITPDCCTACDESVSVAVPGVAGAAGAAGAAGSDGENAYTTLTAQFIMPAEGANVTAAVVNSDWMTSTQMVYVQNCGWMQVQSKPTSASVILKNMEVTADSEYTENVAPAAVIANASAISPGGLQGPAGADGASGAPDTASYWTSTTEAALSGETNMGLLTTGLVKHVVAAGVSTPATAVADTDYIGVDAGLIDLGTVAMVADRAYYTTADNVHAAMTVTAFARTILDDAAAGNVRTTLGLGTAAVEPVATFLQTANNLSEVTAATARTNLGLSPVATDYISIEDQKAAGTDGGTFTSGAWRTRDLNTEVTDTGNHCTLAANQFTLATGTYRVMASAMAHEVNNHKCRLYNITDAATECVGTSMESGAADDTSNWSHIAGRFTIAAPKVFELQHQCETTKATTGFGEGHDFGEVEVFAKVQLEREAG